MKVKYFLSLLLLILLIILLLPSNTLATKWAYPFVVWNGYIYVVQDEYVTEIDSEIGVVTKYSDMEEYSGNFSNVYKKGTKYYSIKGISTDESIAVQENGMYKKAVREGEYTFKDDSSDTVKGDKYNLSGLFLGILVTIIIVFCGIAYGKTIGRK